MNRFNLSTVSAALVLLAIVLLPFQSAQARETGFEIGNDLKAVTLEGRVEVRCMGSGSPGYAAHYCRAETLSPAETSRFVTDRAYDADKVTLVATHEDGSTREKSSVFMGEAGRSKKEFNLGIRTLLQRPLLEGGRNDIAYTLEKDGRVVKTGHFTARVSAGGRLFCPNRTITSMDMEDCRNSFFICQRYFRESNHCQ